MPAEEIIEWVDGGKTQDKYQGHIYALGSHK